MNSPLFCRDKTGKIISNFLNVNWYSEENRTFTVRSDFFTKINKEEYKNKTQQAKGS